MLEGEILDLLHYSGVNIPVLHKLKPVGLPSKSITLSLTRHLSDP